MSLGKRLINTGGVAAAVCNTESVQAFGAESAFSSNVALYQLDGNADDTTTNYDGTATNVTYSTGQFGQAAVFNGSSSYVSISATNTTPLDLSQENYSISAWVKFDTFSGDRAIISKWGGSASLRSILWWVSNGSIKFIEGGSADSIHSSTATLSSTGTWYHLVYIRSASESKIFINNSLDSTFARTQTIRQGGTEPYYLGSQSAGGFKNLDGDIDQVRIFDRAITPEEVSILYNETDVSNTNPLSDGSGVALYSLDYDASDAGGLYDGTPTDVDFGVGGQINYGARFNGSSSYIDVSSFSFGSDNLSISMWIKPSSTQNAYANLFDFQHSSSDAGVFTIQQDNANTNQYKVWQWSGGAYNISNAVTLTANTWNHLVYTLQSNGNYVLYLNGTSSTTGSNLTANTSSLTKPLNIGRWQGNPTPGRYFNGDIDQVRIFSKALNQTEVDTLYAETACVYTATTTDNYFPLADGSSDAVAYIPFDNSAEDLISGDFGTLGSGTEFRFGRFGQAIVGNQNTWSADFPNISETANSPFSVSCWVNIADRNSTIYFFLWSSGFGASSAWGGLLAGQSGKYYTNFGNQVLVSSASVVPPLNQWFHYVLTYDGTNVKVYSDTEKVIDGNINTSALASNNLKVLYNASSSEAKIDQMRIYDVALTSAQVSQLYNEKPETDTSNFKAVLYEGNGSTQYISNVGFDLDADNGGDGGLVWIKARSSAIGNVLIDSVRGASKLLQSETTSAETTYAGVTSFDANGFTVNGSGIVGTNANTVDYVAWVLKGGGDAVLNEEGSIDSQVSANTEAGFSIVKYTGNGSVATVGHGLDNPPEMIIIKNLDNTVAARNWAIYHNGVDANPENYFLRFNAESKLDYPIWNDTAPNSDVFTLGDTSQVGEVNDNNNEHIAYCFHSVDGYQKVGGYTGTGATNSFTGFGFQPRWIMIKRTDSTGNWWVFDSTRGNNKGIRVNLSNAEEDTDADANTYEFRINFISDGFQYEIDNSTSPHPDLNVSSGTYIYLAIA